MSKQYSILLLILLLSACVQKEHEIIDRESLIPQNATKITPDSDLSPPVLHSSEWEQPVPLPYPVSTAGAEDSPFITPDGKTLYFFFTPDVNVPVEKQVIDGVTGIYVSRKINNTWTKPERVWLQDPGKLSLDGCAFVQDNRIWFCAAREGYTGLHWFTAEFVEGKWQNWNIVDFNPEYEVGELHISADGKQLYYHSSKEGGKGNYDIWVSYKENNEWQQPKNLEAVNSPENDGWPFLSQDGSELWFLRTYLGTPAIFRSKRTNGAWSEPELIISQFAGEPSLDNEGNIYFVHHYYDNGKMIEADIWVARRK